MVTEIGSSIVLTFEESLATVVFSFQTIKKAKCRFALLSLFLFIAFIPPLLSSAKPITPMSAYSADDFVDSEGINTQFYLKTYFSDPALPAYIKSLAIRHVRDDIIKGDHKEITRLNELSSLAGVKFDLITDGGEKAFGPNAQSANDIASFVQAVPATEAIEAPNEYDLRGPGWRNSLLAYLPTLKAAATGLEIFGPAFTSLAAYDQAGNLATYQNDVNFHNYFPGYPPENAGFGATFNSCGNNQSESCGRSGSLDFEKRSAELEGPNQSIVCTETGYGTRSKFHEVDYATQAKYVPRLLLNQFSQGVKRTYIFQLVDHFAQHAAFGSYGLLSASSDYRSHQPKPVFKVLQMMNHLLADPGRHFVPDPLAMSIDDQDVETHSVLLGKRDGTYWLAIWKAATSFAVESAAPTAIDVPHHQAILRLEKSKVLTSFAFDSGGNVISTRYSKARQIAIDVSDSVTLYRIK